LHKVGLLSKDNMDQVPFAFKLYKSTSESKKDVVPGFKKTFCLTVPIHFLGVWDTTASVGIVPGKSLPFVDENPGIMVFRQGLALDEQRTKYRTSLYRHGDSSAKAPEKEGTTGDNTDNTPSREKPTDADETDVKEVWFVGGHSDVGGGNPSKDPKHALSDIPLRWMIEEIIRTRPEIEFDENEFARWNIPTTGEDLEEQGGATKDDADAQNAVQDFTDPPAETSQSNRKLSFKRDRGSPRDVPPNSLFHPSVKTRMEKLDYKPKAKYEKDKVEFKS